MPGAGRNTSAGTSCVDVSMSPTESLFPSTNTSSFQVCVNPVTDSVSLFRVGGAHPNTVPATVPSSALTGADFSKYVSGVPAKLSTSKARSTNPTSLVCGVLITVVRSPQASAVDPVPPPGMSNTEETPSDALPLAESAVPVSIILAFHTADMLAIFCSSTIVRA